MFMFVCECTNCLIQKIAKNNGEIMIYIPFLYNNLDGERAIIVLLIVSVITKLYKK